MPSHFWPFREYGGQAMLSAGNRDTEGKDKKQRPRGLYSGNQSWSRIGSIYILFIPNSFYSYVSHVVSFQGAYSVRGWE